MSGILQKTYDVLDARGWCQNVHQSSDGRVCLEGAFAYAIGAQIVEGVPSYDYRMEEPENDAAWRILCNTVKEETGIEAPLNWNDHPSTSVEDVKLVLKKAIERESM
jgi:hypothetical protein